MYLVGVMRSSRSSLALLPRCELSQVAVVISLPATKSQHCTITTPHDCDSRIYAHLVVEDLALARLGLGDQALVEHIEHILADALQLLLDLLAVLADDANVLVGTLGLLFLLNAGDDAPRGAARADHVLVGHGEKVALVDCELAADLQGGALVYRGHCVWWTKGAWCCGDCVMEVV